MLLLAAALLSLLGWGLYLLAFRSTRQVRSLGLFPPGPSFEDLNVYLTRFEVFRRREFFVPVSPGPPRSFFAYPPGAALCYRLLYRWGYQKKLFSALLFAWWGTLLTLTVRGLRRAGATRAGIVALCLVCLCSYPIWFLYQRGNIEIFLWILLFLSALAYSRQHIYWAAVGIGIAASIKLYPILLLGLFLQQRRHWTAVVACAATAVVATVVEIWRCAPGFFWYGAHGFFGGVAQFQAKYAGSTQAGNGEYDHSLFSWVKSVAMHLHADPRAFTRPYYVVCGGLSLAVYLLFVRQKPFLNRLTFLLVMMVLLPPVSFTYTLVHLYLPLLLLAAVLLRRGDDHARTRSVLLVALGCLLFLMLPIDLYGPLVRSAGKIQVLPLLVLLWAAARTPWQNVKKAEPAQPGDNRVSTLLANPAL